MNTFHFLTFFVSILILLGLFVYSAIVFYSGRNTLFPHDMSPCPDNWKMNPDGTCQIPMPGPRSNLGRLGQTGQQIYIYDNDDSDATYSYLPKYYDTASFTTYQGKPATNLPRGYYKADIPAGYDVENPQKGSVNFHDPEWASHGDPYCAIKKWAQTQNIQWDGILSYNNGCL
jgi:hypothetical protein